MALPQVIDLIQLLNQRIQILENTVMSCCGRTSLGNESIVERINIVISSMTPEAIPSDEAIPSVQDLERRFSTLRSMRSRKIKRNRKQNLRKSRKTNSMNMNVA